MGKASDTECKLRCKVGVVGSPGCGKTALLNMTTSKGQVVQKQYKMTSTVELQKLDVPVPDTKAEVQFLLLDTPGNELLAQSAIDMWGGASWVMLVYDITNKDSFESCQKWYHTVQRKMLENGQTIKAVVVGNKKDLQSNRHIDMEVVSDWARSMGVACFQTSATTGSTDFMEPFEHIAKEVHSVYNDSISTFQNCLGSGGGYM